MEEKIPMTQKGYEVMQAELKKLRFEDRKEVVAAIEEARAHGDLSENAEYHAARERQSFIEGRILELEAVVCRAQVIDIEKLSGQKVLFGATVDLEESETGKKMTYQIVGQYEANLEKGLLSLQAPLARALIGKEVGDFVEFNSPSGTKVYEILNVRFVA